MNNIRTILFYQYHLPAINQKIRNIQKLFLRKRKEPPAIISDIDYFKNGSPKDKRALISLSPGAWLCALRENPDIKLFNYVGLTFEMVKVLNKNGYLVDIVDFNIEYLPDKKYDLFIGHGGKCRTIIDNLAPATRILQYVSGAYWKQFNQMSEERYTAFTKRKNVNEKLTFKRSLVGLIEGEEYLTNKANVLFTFECPRTIKTYGEYKNKFYFTGYGAYLDQRFGVSQEERNFDDGKRNFIYVGGTSGNIQKGMDLLIEAFTRTPELNLFIYCKVEQEILKYYKEELMANNIRYIYHWRFSPFQEKLKKLLRKVNFTIHAPINAGIGTAFAGSMGVGMIPVGYIDLMAPQDSCVLSDSWDIDALVYCAKEASRKSTAWCKNASELTIKNYQDNWSVESFAEKFDRLIKLK
jgi:glycosyltransferase involved in cell wall biosynthesis